MNMKKISYEMNLQKWTQIVYIGRYLWIEK